MIFLSIHHIIFSHNQYVAYYFNRKWKIMKPQISNMNIHLLPMRNHFNLTLTNTISLLTLDFNKIRSVDTSSTRSDSVRNKRFWERGNKSKRVYKMSSNKNKRPKRMLRFYLRIIGKHATIDLRWKTLRWRN